MINDFNDYPYLKNKKDIFESSIDDSFEFIITTYFNNTFTTTDDFILAFKKGIKRSVYNFYRNNRIACKDNDENIRIMFTEFLDDYLYSDIPTFNYFYKLSSNLETKILNNGSYTDSVSYTDKQKDVSKTDFSSNGVTDTDTSSTSSSTSKDDLSTFSKNADTPTITQGTETFIDKYTNSQSKDTSSGTGSNESTSKTTNSMSNVTSNSTDKTYTKDSEYSKNVTHKEETSLKEQIELINSAINDLVKTYVKKLRDCFIIYEELYELYEGEEYD